MIRRKESPYNETRERQALRRRVKRMYNQFNRGSFGKCFALIDPQLRQQGKVRPATYHASLQSFRQAYGSICPWHLRINLHLKAGTNPRDPRPFAYVYVIWQDRAHEFHLFRERWVRDSDGWYTRVAGLVVNRKEPVGND